ncbi:TRAP transporter substrate-binding protein DctP [Bacillus dakarensis]|uniref:TRAP transporter substrate-binding protein n=1 Tax=Robertmurraya dakarensis TaxID=1926278 RepID=UPI000980B877|nr:TRAP transporter substrate-binding protein DctP [Bacillus dakarensis]
MNKFKRSAVCVFAIFIIFFITACGNDETQVESTTDKEGNVKEGETITLKVADSFPTTHVISKEGIVIWMDEVEKLTDGKVTFEHFPSEQLGKADSMLDVVKNNVADIASNVPSYLGDRLLLSTVPELPGTFKTTYQGSQAYNELLLNNEELKRLHSDNGVRPIWGALLGPYQVSTTNKKIQTVEDFKGLKIRASGNTQELIYQSLKASPISMPAPDQYVALQRGTISATSYMVPNWEAYSLQEELKYSTTNGAFGTTAFSFVINERVWESLPQDVQNAMIDAGKTTMEHFSRYLDGEFDESVEKFKIQGIDMYEISNEELESIYSIIQKPTFDDWLKKASKNGYDSQSVLDDYLNLVEQSPLE